MSREVWKEKLANAALLVGDEVDVDALVARFGELDEPMIDELASAAGRCAIDRGDSHVQLKHFASAAGELGIEISAPAEPISDGGCASPSRVDDLDDRVANIESNVRELQSHVGEIDTKVDRLTTAMRDVADVLDAGNGGGRNV